jgi:DNA polymerase III gamma/tau subunit
MPETTTTHELYKRHRPQKLSEVIGQPHAIAQLRKSLQTNKVDHSILFNGPTGTGKTTLMRIMRRALKCSKNDYVEINTADFRGIDTIRDLRRNLSLAPLGGACRVIAIDECHSLSRDAQNAILKLLEDTPAHVYFMLGTTDPQKLLAALLGRCTEVKLKALSQDDLELLIREVIKKESLVICEEIISEIATAANGSARKALVILDAVSKAEGDEDQKRAIAVTSIDKDLAFGLAKLLMWGKKKDWTPVAIQLQKMKDEDPEGVRHCVLGLARAMIVGKEGKPPSMQNASRAYDCLNAFEDNFWDSHGPGLALACWRTVFAE